MPERALERDRSQFRQRRRRTKKKKKKLSPNLLRQKQTQPNSRASRSPTSTSPPIRGDRHLVITRMNDHKDLTNRVEEIVKKLLEENAQRASGGARQRRRRPRPPPPAPPLLQLLQLQLAPPRLGAS